MVLMPTGASQILAARQRGMRPADLILVSTVGPLTCEANPVVLVKTHCRYVWHWVRGLALCFWCDGRHYDPQLILDAACHRPAAMYLWNWVTRKGYDLSVQLTPESIDRLPPEWRFNLQADRWQAWQERQFAAGEAP